jgi:hypothetical protein
LGPNVRPESVGAWHPPLALGWEAEEMVPGWRPPMAWPRSQTELTEGEHELTLLREVYGNVMDPDKNAYAHYAQNAWVLHLEQYLRDRDAFFGSTTDYLSYKAIAQAELDEDKEKLRRVIDPSDRKNKPRWHEAQVPFYAWTRRAYEKVAGSGVNIRGAILLGTSEKLREALKQVRSDYGQKFVEQGFNPRPIKLDGTYKLGTISDHAFGTAVDIEPATNPQLREAQWDAILKLTGKTLDVPTRRAKWLTAPFELHSAIKEISDAFVTKVNELVDAQKDEKDPLAAAIKAEPQLAKLKKDFVVKWRSGFFTLSWALVKELHEEKLVWGAIFKDPDLHHFELP